jgi:hypothetical protein
MNGGYTSISYLFKQLSNLSDNISLMLGPSYVMLGLTAPQSDLRQRIRNYPILSSSFSSLAIYIFVTKPKLIKRLLFYENMFRPITDCHHFGMYAMVYVTKIKYRFRIEIILPILSYTGFWSYKFCNLNIFR